jgi:hypothetical protein
MLTPNGLLPESLIWTYVIQMTSPLRCIHSAGLACRTLDPTKILIINKTRLLLNCCGIFDVLTFDPTSSNPMAAMAHYQQEDLIALGKIVLGTKNPLENRPLRNLAYCSFNIYIYIYIYIYILFSSCMQLILGYPKRESSDVNGDCDLHI